MPAQVVLNGLSNGVNGMTSDIHAQSLHKHRAAAALNTEGFQWGEVDEKFMKLAGHHEAAHVLAKIPSASAAALVTSSALQLPPLGPLANFHGPFKGTGMNIIFRPTNGSTKFPSPVQGPAPPAAPNDQVLEINLTEEKLVFSDPLGDVPNRGFGTQKDIHLNGVPYVQTVNDVTNPATGQADAPPTAIHFEPGVWMHVPATTDPTGAATLSRMASIPHGTTINAQCLSPTTAVAGPPNFTLPQNIVDITPFPIGQPANTLKNTFPSLTATNQGTSRLPQDLTNFIAEGTITQDILDNPNKILSDAIKGQKITQTIVFKVSTGPQGTNPIAGGGTANIDFLSGDDKSDGPNADVPLMTATFWIETVEHQVTLPAFPPGKKEPVRLQPSTAKAGAPVPTFVVHPPPVHVTAPRTITVKSTQIQYSQTVILNFAGLSWPHVSVATLVPDTELAVSVDP